LKFCECGHITNKFQQPVINHERLSHQHFLQREDEAYVADIPDLKYCSAIAETPQQALHEVILAKTAWLEVVKAQRSLNTKKTRFASLFG
jgi:predicted RNase H-like HicB family nuclease